MTSPGGFLSCKMSLQLSRSEAGDPALHPEGSGCTSSCYKMQPTGFNTRLVQAPPNADACLAKGAKLWRSSQECCCLALNGGGRPLGTQMHKLRPAILVPSTAVWETSALLLPQLQGSGLL